MDTNFSSLLFLDQDPDLKKVLLPIIDEIDNPVTSLVLYYGVPYEIKEEYVTFFLFKDYKFKVDIVDLVYAIWQVDRTMNQYYDIFADLPPLNKSFFSYLNHGTIESGQLKIASSLIDAISDKYNAVIIGSGGKDFSLSGRSYMALDNLPLSGKCTLIDPREKQSVSTRTTVDKEGKSHTIEYNIVSAMFDYDNALVDETVTLVHDDSYDQVIYDPPDDKKRYIIDTNNIVSGQFVIVDQGNHFEIVCVKDHQDIKNCLAGGSIHVTASEEVYITGTSGTHGPYNHRAIKRSFPLWHVDKSYRISTKFKLEKLKRIFPKAVMVVKELDDDGRGYAQRFYNSRERRVYVNCVSPSHMECQLCSSVRFNARRLGIGTHDIYRFYASIYAETCTPVPLRKNLHLRNLVLVCAKDQCSISKTLDFISARGFKASKIVETIRYLRVQGKIFIHHASNKGNPPTEDLNIEQLREMGGADAHLSLQGKNVAYKHFAMGKDLSKLRKMFDIKSIIGEYCYTADDYEQGDTVCYYGSSFNAECDIAVVVGANSATIAKYERTNYYLPGYFLPLFINRFSANGTKIINRLRKSKISVEID